MVAPGRWLRTARVLHAAVAATGVAAGTDIRTVQELLGHSDLSIAV